MSKKEQKDLFEFTYEPIRGYPELRWTGKRPFTGTPYYPAQLKESFGDDTDGWRNKIYWGDNLQVMSHLLKDYRGKVNLIYIDPPFDSKACKVSRLALLWITLSLPHSTMLTSTPPVTPPATPIPTAMATFFFHGGC